MSSPFTHFFNQTGIFESNLVNQNIPDNPQRMIKLIKRCLTEDIYHLESKLQTPLCMHSPIHDCHC